jgi:hypothetical protein
VDYTHSYDEEHSFERINSLHEEHSTILLYQLSLQQTLPHRHLPNPCKAFYTARLHDQSWVRGDYSDVMVTMSRVYEVIRGDEKVVSNDDEKQVCHVF